MNNSKNLILEVDFQKAIMTKEYFLRKQQKSTAILSLPH